MNAVRKPSAKPGFVDGLGWGVLEDSGIVTCRSGTVIGGFWSDPPDASSWLRDRREVTTGRLNAALRTLGTGWGLWSDCCVVPHADYPPAEASHFPSPVARALDNERRRTFLTPNAHFRRDHSIVLGRTPAYAVEGKVRQAIRQDEEAKASVRRSGYDLSMADLRAEMNRIENQAGDAIGLSRMGGYVRTNSHGDDVHYDELVNLLACAAFGDYVELALPRDGMFLDTVLGGDDWWTGDFPRLGGQRIACITLEGFPAEGMPGILDHLFDMEAPFRLSQRFLFLDPEDGAAECKRYANAWGLKIVPYLKKAIGLPVSMEDQDAVAMQSDAKNAMAFARGGKAAFGFYTATLVLRHEHVDALKDMARTAERLINNCGFRARLETVNATEAFLGTMPGNMRSNVRMPPVHTQNLSDTMPTSGVWRGHDFAPSPMLPPGSPALAFARTAGGQRFGFNVHTLDNGAHAWFGPPGCGKTSGMNLEAYQFLRYPGAKNRGIDIKAGMLVACSAAGGRWRDVGGEEPAFAPFARLDTSADRLWAAQFVAACFSLQHGGRLPNPTQRTAIRNAIAILKEQPSLRSLTNFCLAVQDQEVREAMATYRGGLMDATTEEAAEGFWDVYDMTALMHAGSQILVPAVMCLLRRFERGIDGNPQLWLMDEVAVQIAEPIWEPRLRAMLKLNRSRNVATGLATQNLVDMPDALATIVKENVPNRIMGANHAADIGGMGDERGPADFYQAFGYNARQRSIIKHLAPKRQFYVSQGDDHRTIDFELGPLALALCASTSEADVIRAKAVLAETGPGLPFAREWCRFKGVDHAILS